MKQLEADKYVIKKRKIYDPDDPEISGLTYKFDNRRVSVVKTKTDFIFEFRLISKNNFPRALCDHIHGKMSLTKIKLSKEVAEIVMVSLAEQMGFKICK